MRMLNDLILLVPDVPNEMVGSIYIPTAAREAVRTGRVALVGPGSYTRDDVFVVNPIQPGDRILFNPESTTDLMIDDQPFSVIKLEKVLGVVE